MPPVRSLAFKRYAYIVTIILLFNKIMPICFRYTEKKLVYIIITAPSSCQPFYCSKCIKLNIYLSCDIKLVFNAKCISRFPYNIYSLSQLLGRNI